MEHAGAISLMPALATLFFALVFRRTFEALLGGVAIGFILLQFTNDPSEDGRFFLFQAFDDFVGTLYEVIGDPVTVWLILVVGLFGSLLALLIKSGGALAFGMHLSERVKSRKGALFTASLLGFVIFIDDYLNALAVSTAMKRVTDKYKVSREYLAYVVDSTAAPVCVLFPLSTWAVYTSGLLVENGLAEDGMGIQAFLYTIPFNLYAIFSLAVVLLTIAGVIPMIGPMKKAQERVEGGGELAPPNSETISSMMDSTKSIVEAEKAKAFNFFVPILALIFFSWFLGADFSEGGSIIGEVKTLEGVMLAILVTSVLYIVQRICSIEEFSKTFFAGFQGMLYPTAIVVMSFVLVNINDKLGLTNFVIENVKPIMAPMFLPVVVFLSMSFIAFSTGSFWGMYAITIPIVAPLAIELDVNVWLAMGAVISAGAFGSHMCPFGDSTVLSSAGSGCNNIAHVYTQAPYGIISCVAASIMYIILGAVL